MLCNNANAPERGMGKWGAACHSRMLWAQVSVVKYSDRAQNSLAAALVTSTGVRQTTLENRVLKSGGFAVRLA